MTKLVSNYPKWMNLGFHDENDFPVVTVKLQCAGWPPGNVQLNLKRVQLSIEMLGLTVINRYLSFNLESQITICHSLPN